MIPNSTLPTDSVSAASVVHSDQSCPTPKGPAYLSIILNAHTPYVRHPKNKPCNDEYWLFDHILDSYLPLLDSLERLHAEGVPYRLTLSLSPTLLEMLDDPIIQERFDTYLENKINLGVREADRCLLELELSELIDHYLTSLRYYRDKFNFNYNRDLIGAFRNIAQKNCLELITTAASHALMPMLYPYGALGRAQIGVGRETFKRHIGLEPQGFWLPECAFNPGLERLLFEQGYHYTITTTCENLGAVPHPTCGVSSPLHTLEDFVFFPSDPQAELEVWSSKSGFFNDPAYRNSLRDLSDELPDLDLGDLQLPNQSRPSSGFRYYRNGSAASSSYYVLEQGRSRAKLHAQTFIENRLRQADRIVEGLPHPPIITLALNAEFLGSMWYEGHMWLEDVCRLVAENPEKLQLASPGQLTKYADDFAFAMPNSGTWLDGGFAARWLNCSNDWVISTLSVEARHFYQMVKLHGHDPRFLEPLNQALRELLLAQASDWPLLLSTGQYVNTARKKLRNHLVAFNKLYEDAQEGRVDLESLRNLEQRTSIFADLDYRQFFFSKDEQYMTQNTDPQHSQILNYLLDLKNSTQSLLDLCQGIVVGSVGAEQKTRELSQKAATSVSLVEKLAKQAGSNSLAQSYKAATSELESLIQEITQAETTERLEELRDKSSQVVDKWSQSVESLLKYLLTSKDSNGALT